MKTNLKWLVAGIVASASLATAGAADADFYNSKLALIRQQPAQAAVTIEPSIMAAEYSTKWALTATRRGAAVETPVFAAASFDSKRALRGAAVEAVEIAPVK